MRFKAILTEILAAGNAMLMGLPGNIIFGILAFAPLGTDYISYGILSSLLGALIVGLITALFSGTPVLISGPRPPIALLFGSIIAGFSATLAEKGIHVSVDIIMTYAFITSALSGFMQILFGYYKLGALVRFVPIGVINGFVAASSVAIIIGQFSNITGLDPKLSLVFFDTIFNQIELGAVIIAVFTAIVTWNSQLFIKYVPEGILGILFGTILYYGLLQLYPELSFGDTLDTPSIELSKLLLFPVLSFDANFSWEFYIVAIISSAFGMALLSSIDTLLTSTVIDTKKLERSEHNMDLSSQGLANLVSSLLGGLAGAGKVGVCLYALKFNAATRITPLLQALFYIPIILYALPVLDLLPKAVLGGVAVTIGFKLIEPAIFSDLSIFFSKGNTSLNKKFNSIIIFLIILSTLIWDMLTAMMLGLIVSILFFLLSFSGSIIRRELNGNAIISTHRRSLDAQTIIDENRNSVRLMQLEGAVFFGSVELLVRRIESIIQDTTIRYIILDIHRVAEIDDTGASIIQYQQMILRKKGIYLLLSYVIPGSILSRELSNHMVCNKDGEKYCFPDTSSAFSWCEEDILEKKSKSINFDYISNLKQIELFDELDEASFNVLSKYLRKISYEGDSIIFKQGDIGNFILFIVKGNVEVFIDLPGMSHGKQLQILGPGTVVGEMALIDGKPRSANLKALNQVTCLTMTRKLYMQLIKNEPEIATKFLSGLCKIFSERLRVANRTIVELEI